MITEQMQAYYQEQAGILLEAKNHWMDRALTAEKALALWRQWAQFVYLGGGPVTLPDDDELRAAVCAAHDADVVRAKDSAA